MQNCIGLMNDSFNLMLDVLPELVWIVDEVHTLLCSSASYLHGNNHQRRVNHAYGES